MFIRVEFRLCDLCVWLSGVRNCSFAFLPLASMKCLGLYYGGSMGFEGVPGFLLSVLLIGVISGLLGVGSMEVHGTIGAFTAYFDGPVD